MSIVSVRFVEPDIVIELVDNKIKICGVVLNTMKKYRQLNKKDNEAGGIIVGRENLSNSNLIFEFITEPMKGDKRSRTRYLRKDKMHIEYYQTLYNNNDGIYAYIGEWHTHPESTPHYSGIDFENWKKIGKEVPHSKQYHIIIGTKAIAIWEYSNKTKMVSKLCNIEWEILKNHNEENS